jgi:molybdopterin-containing oxidoreductase family iron-sulfur binding subunit
VESISASAADTQRASSSPSGEIDRRALIGHLLAVGATSLAAAMGGTAMAALASATALAAPQPADHPGRRKFRYGMVIDTRRCVGCRACVVACKAENKTPPGVFYTVVVDQAIEPRIDDKPLFMTKPCFHCETPPCVDVCPVSATYKRERDGIVVIDYERCIGCRYCMTACPYSARWFDFGENYPAVGERTAYAGVPSPEYDQFRTREHERSPIGNVRKCTFCLHLQDAEGRYDKAAGRWPACAKTCTGHAIHFGDFNDPESEVSRLLRERVAVRLKEELGTNPNVYYLL